MLTIAYLKISSAEGAQGDAVFDRRLLDALTERATVRVYTLPLNTPRRRRLLELRGYGADAAQYYSGATEKGVKNLLDEWQPDFTILSHEATGFLTKVVPSRSIVVLHNFMVHDPIRLAGPAQAYRKFNRVRYAKRLINTAPRVAVLSKLDENAVLSCTEGRRRPIRLSPGMPPSLDLNSDAGFDETLVLTGTYNWDLKKRDFDFFLQQYSRYRPYLIACSNGVYANLPTSLHQLIIPVTKLDTNASLRVGVITDRFVAGFKLKALEYISMNCAVISFCDIKGEFSHLPHADEFILYVTSVSEMMEHVARLKSSSSAGLIRRFSIFKKACATEFAWDRTADILFALINGPKEQLLQGTDKRSYRT